MIKLKTSNFLGIHSTKKSTKIEFNSRMTVLTGFNGSGKSSILLGIFLTLDGANDRKDKAILTPRKNWGIELELVDYNYKPNFNNKKLFSMIPPKINIEMKLRYLILEHQNAEVLNKISNDLTENMEKTFEESFNNTLRLCKVEENNRKTNTFSNYILKERVPENTELFSYKVPIDNKFINMELASEYGEKIRKKDIKIFGALYQDEKFFYTNNLEGIGGLKNLDVFTENNNLDKSIYFLLIEFRKKILSADSDLPQRLVDEVLKHNGNTNELYNLFKNIIEKKFSYEVYAFLEKMNEFFIDINKKVCITDTGDIYFEETNKTKKTKKNVNWYDCSKGEKNLLSLLLMTYIYKDTNTIFILDEPDLAMHINWQKKLLRAFLEIAPQSQFIVSTHSPALIPQDTKEIDFVNVTKLKEEMESYGE